MIGASRRNVVMLFTNSFEPFQGRYHRVYNEAQALLAAGYRVTLLAWDRRLSCPREEDVDGIRVIRFRLRAGERTGPRFLPRLMAYWVWALAQLLQRECDILHLHNVDVLPLGFVVRLSGSCAVVLDVCEPDYYAMWDERLTPLVNLIAWMEKSLSRYMDYVLVHNRYQIRKYRHWRIARLAQIGSYPTLNMVRKHPRPAKPEGAPIVFGTVGTFFHNSGVEETVAAFRQLSVRHENVCLLLAGRVMDYYRERFAALIRPLGDRVQATGAFAASRIPEIYEKIDVSVMVCERDRWYRNITPTKFFDSLASGVPVIASDIGGLGELVNELRCGIIVDERNIEEIVAAMEYMVQHPQEREEMGKRALEAAQSEYNFDRMAKRLVDVYAQLRC